MEMQRRCRNNYPHHVCVEGIHSAYLIEERMVKAIVRETKSKTNQTKECTTMEHYDIHYDLSLGN